MRLDRLMNLKDYLDVARNRAGGHIVTNASFQGSPGESIRVNLQSPNCSCRRTQSESETFPREHPPFDVLSPSLMFSLDQLGQWRNNFVLAHEALGEKPLGSIKTSDSVHELILSRLQASSFEIAHVDSVLDALPVETSLYGRYNQHPKTVSLFRNGKITVDGRELLEHFEEACSVYSQIPELRSYFDQTTARSGDLGPRGQRFREWLQQVRELPAESACSMAYVAHELKPWHMSGKEFRWKQDQGDLRLASVDLLCRHQGQPVWCEVKMAGDTWASSAVLQILFYGSGVSTCHQRRRLKRTLPDQFTDARPWLAVIVENRDNADFIPDLEQAIAFAQYDATKARLQPHFDGMFFVVISPEDEGWAVDRSVMVHW